MTPGYLPASLQNGEIENSLNGDVTYELERMPDDYDSRKLPIVIDRVTGEITLSGQLDYEERKVWKVSEFVHG